MIFVVYVHQQYWPVFFFFFFFSVVTFFSFDIGVMVASLNELRSIPYSAIFWKSFRSIGVNSSLFDNSHLWSHLKWKKVKFAQSCPILCDPIDYTAQGILLPRILKWVAIPFLQGIFQTQGSKWGLPHWRQPETPRNTGMGSLSLLQGVIPTQESNRGLLHYRRIL